MITTTELFLNATKEDIWHSTTDWS